MNRLKELRKKHGLTLRKLGKELGMYDSTLSQYETERRHPKLEVWKKLADYFGVSVSYLMGIDTKLTEEQETCLFCHDGTEFPLIGNPENEDNLPRVWIEGNILYVTNPAGGCVGTVIGSCPKCGRKLSDR